MDQETLDILAGLNAAQPTTQQVDYSGFMQDFQPVLNQPNYFVPQQGLLQNTPTLDTLSDLDVMQQRPQSLLNMLNQYPTLESDFQRSFAVNPDTFNMNVYQPLPYDADYWNSFATQAGGTTGGDDTLGAVIGGGLLANKLLGGDDDTTTTTTDDTVIDIDPNTIIPTITLDDDTTVITGTGSETSTSGTDVVNVTVTTDDDTNVTGKGDDTSTSGTDVLNVTVNDDDTNVTGKGDDTSISGTDVLNVTSTENTNNNQGTGSDTSTSGTDVSSISNNFDLTDTSTWVWGGNPFSFNVTRTDGTTDVINIESEEQLDRLINSQNKLTTNNINKNIFDSSLINTVLGNNLLNTGGGLNFTTEFGVNKTGLTGTGNNASNSNLSNSVSNQTNLLSNNTFSVGDKIFLQNSDGTFAQQIQTIDPISNKIQTTYVDVDGDPRGMFDRVKGGFTDFMNNPLNEGFGAAGSGLNDATQFTGGELLSLGGGLLSFDAALEEATPTNVFGSAVGLGASGLLGGTAQALATHPLTAPIGMALLFAEQLAPPDSGKTGSGAFDYNTSTNTEFGMAGDKFKQGHVDTASTISQSIGTAINTIADGYGLNVEGDHLVEFGRERPLSLSFGDQESEQTSDNRLNYSAETGDITNSTDTMKRFYYTGTDGNDGTALANNVIKGTNFISLKAIANGEDTINMQDFRLPAFSADKVKNQYLDMGLDETAANALTSASRSGSAATSELLGGLLVANTTNENLFLTDKEVTSLLEKGYTEEQIDEILYG